MKLMAKALGIGLAITAASTAFAAAASLALGSQSLSAGSAAVTSCGVSSLSATRNVDNSGNVTQLNVLSVPQACAGEVLTATLENSSNASLGSSAVIVGTCTGGCTVSMTGFGTVSATNVTAYALSITE